MSSDWSIPSWLTCIVSSGRDPDICLLMGDLFCLNAGWLVLFIMACKIKVTQLLCESALNHSYNASKLKTLQLQNVHLIFTYSLQKALIKLFVTLLHCDSNYFQSVTEISCCSKVLVFNKISKVMIHLFRTSKSRPLNQNWTRNH